MICSKCSEDKSIEDDFYNSPLIISTIKLENGNGVLRRCKTCIAKEGKIYRTKHSEKRTKQSKEWAKNNPDKRKKIQKKYAQNNKEKLQRYRKAHSKKFVLKAKLWAKNNPERNRINKKRAEIKKLATVKGQLDHRISSGIRKCLKGKKGGQSWENLLPYSLKQLKAHLKKTMPTGYAWKDFLEGKLHIDHKIPLRVFSYEKPTDLHFLKAWALKNLQLLPAKENILKSDKIEQPFQGVLSI